ncbi:MAG TPA: periplasmic heavy metal sensor, partial [Novosphingobium sp.]|nr:periplasmic heavy metal sensor [Novosphingobium sp.]
LEADFATQRQALDARLREANAGLAAAMASEHQYGPKVAEAVDRCHMAMGELQKATLRHVFAMRAVLRPDQAARFDEAVAKALTQPAQH